jgi:hypothetical protein
VIATILVVVVFIIVILLQLKKRKKKKKILFTKNVLTFLFEILTSSKALWMGRTKRRKDMSTNGSSKVHLCFVPVI